WTVIWYTQQGILLRESFPLTVLEEAHRIMFIDPSSMTFTTSQRSFVRYRWSFTREEIEENQPIYIKLFKDNEEIPLQYTTEIDWSDEENPIYYWQFYQSFNAGYFEPGSYQLRIEWGNRYGMLGELIDWLHILDDGHRINMLDENSWTFYASENSFIRHGFRATPEALETFDEWLPVNVKVYINDEEIPVTQFTEIDLEDEYPYRWLFYKSFEAWYFVPGETYNLRVVWSNRNGIVWEREESLTILPDP
ncbi:MAG: hypothetical protein ACXAEU_18060, partial [Candidatus Hodarchaeales archaeon]